MARTGSGAIYPAMANSVMMYEALGYPEDHPGPGHRPRLDRQARRPRRRGELLPALRVAGVGHGARLPHAARSRRRPLGRERPARPAVAAAATGARGQRRLGDPAAERAARRLGLPVQQRPLSRPRRHRRGGDGDGPAAPAPADQEIRHRHRPRARVDRGHAVRERRLRRLRCRQHPLQPQQHPVRRSRRAARSADRGRHRTLPVDARPARRAAEKRTPTSPARSTICARPSLPTAAGTAAGA